MNYIDQVIEELAAKANHTYTPKQLMDIRQAIAEVAIAAITDPIIRQEAFEIVEAK